MPKLYMLIGVPGSGKSTWAMNQRWDISNTVFASTDKFVEQYATGEGKTYNEVFESFMPEAINLMNQEVIIARKQGKDVVWDQTNITVKSRKKKFNMLPEYEAIAVVFDTPEWEVLDKRLKGRPGKVIPRRVVYQMIEHLQVPTEAEGFKEIWFTS